LFLLPFIRIRAVEDGVIGSREVYQAAMLAFFGQVWAGLMDE
jgi:hypothetical protein